MPSVLYALNGGALIDLTNDPVILMILAVLIVSYLLVLFARQVLAIMRECLGFRRDLQTLRQPTKAKKAQPQNHLNVKPIAQPHTKTRANKNPSINPAE